MAELEVPRPVSRDGESRKVLVGLELKFNVSISKNIFKVSFSQNEVSINALFGRIADGTFSMVKFSVQTC